MRKLIPLLLTATFILSSCAKGSGGASGDLPDEKAGDQDPVGPPERDRGKEVQAKPWQTPAYTAEEESQVLQVYRHLDPDRIVPRNLYKKTLLYYHRNRELIENRTHIGIMDFSQSSRRMRFYILDLNDGKVSRWHVGHGKRSDLNNDGFAERFSNTLNSDQSSLGFFITGEPYVGKHGRSMRLDGLSTTNSNARERAIVIHGAEYVKDANVKQGRSFGCLSFSMATRTTVLNKLFEGALIYAGRSNID